MFVARVLSRQLVDVCGKASGSEVILYPRSDISQVFVPATGFLDGRSQQHPCDPEDDKLYIHVSRSTEAQPLQRQLRAVLVKVRLSAVYMAVVILTWEPSV